MTELRPEWMFAIRQELNDLPEEYLSDESLLRVLVKAKAFVDAVVDTATVDPNLYDQCVVTLGAYYAYLNYTSVVARKMGSIPEYSEARAEQLKKIALSFINLVSKYPIDENFNIDLKGITPVAFTVGGILGENK